jgi:hypothetical protein
MEVVRHQHPGRNAPAEPLDGVAEELEKHQPILIVAKNVAPLVAAGGDVMNGVWKFEAKRSCHGTGEIPSAALLWPRTLH